MRTLFTLFVVWVLLYTRQTDTLKGGGGGGWCGALSLVIGAVSHYSHNIRELS